jgi:hypothetical protein
MQVDAVWGPIHEVFVRKRFATEQRAG